MKTTCGLVFSFAAGAAPLVVSSPDQSGGLETLLRRRTKPKDGQPTVCPPSLKNIPLEYFLRYARKLAYRRSPRARTPTAYFKARSRPFVTPVFPFRQMYISAADRVRVYELRTAGVCRSALQVALGLRCDSILYGTAASQVKVLYGQALSTAVWPAFSVLICAPWLSYCSIIQESLIK